MVRQINAELHGILPLQTVAIQTTSKLLTSVDHWSTALWNYINAIGIIDSINVLLG